MPRRTVYNDDSQGVGEANPGSAEQDLRAWVDKPLSRIPIDTYVWCIAFPDIVMHNSKVGEVYGRRWEPNGTKPRTAHPDGSNSVGTNRATTVIAELHEQGTDVMHVVADQAHRHGVEMIASMRMSDTHQRQPNPNDPGVPQILLDHPEYAIKRLDGTQETALDYSVPEVRTRRLAILKELAEEYEIDGVELDFMRWGKCFARHEAPFKIDLITDFVGQVRTMLNDAARKRGRERLILGVQVPRSLYLCHLCGLDPKSWVRQDWTDYLIQCDFNCTDPQIPVAEFAEFCKDRPCTHHVRMGNMMGGIWTAKPFDNNRKTSFKGNRGYGGMLLTNEEACGTAANAYGSGADGIGYWNICCNMGDRHKPDSHPGVSRAQFQADLIDWTNHVARPDRVWKNRRIYHFLPIYKGEAIRARNYPVNQMREGPLGEPVQIILFSPESVGFRQSFHFLMADGQNGEKLTGSLQVRILQSTLEDKFTIDINGQPINPDDVRAAATPDDELPYVWHEVDLANCPPFKGQNQLGMTMTKLVTQRSDQTAEEQKYEPYPYMEELIIRVDP